MIPTQESFLAPRTESSSPSDWFFKHPQNVLIHEGAATRAAGLRRGYATGGAITVGERGPETITPLTGLNVIPANQGAKSQINANFTIHAIDAQGVEEVLMGQQGNIINMIRSAANDYGTEFLEEIDTTTYGNYSGINSFGGG